MDLEKDIGRGMERSDDYQKALVWKKPLGLGNNLGKREKRIMDDS